LTNPVTVQLQSSGQLCPSLPNQNSSQPWVCYLDPSKDYILKLGHRLPAPNGVDIDGGHNVVMIGGQIDGYVSTDSNEENEGRGLTLEDATGTVHVEGVLINSAFDGIVLREPNAIVQIENVRIANLHAYQDNFNLGHPDIIESQNGPKAVRIDHLTADSDFTGLSWFRSTTSASFPGTVTIKNVNLFGNLQPNTVARWPDGTTMTASPFSNFTYMSTSTVHSCSNCWVLPGWYSQTYQRKLQDTAFGFNNINGSDQVVQLQATVTGYDGQTITGLTGATSSGSGTTSNLGRRQSDYIEFPTNPNLAAVRWYWGTPPTGDFVPTGTAGTTYTTPGYSTGAISAG
jgi:hypothetical protein